MMETPIPRKDSDPAVQRIEQAMDAQELSRVAHNLRMIVDFLRAENVDYLAKDLSLMENQVSRIVKGIRARLGDETKR